MQWERETQKKCVHINCAPLSIYCFCALICCMSLYVKYARAYKITDVIGFEVVPFTVSENIQVASAT